MQQYPPTSECGKNVCPVKNTLFAVATGCALLPFFIAVCYRGIAMQNYVVTLKKLLEAVKRGDTFAVLKISVSGRLSGSGRSFPRFTIIP